jgi:hypothetical protein
MTPGSHKAKDFKSRGHGKAALKSSIACGVCHEKGYCMKCHKVTMPHEKAWIRTHHSLAEKNAAVCAACHTAEECLKCHERKAPSSHVAKTWRKDHGAAGRGRDLFCAMCHEGGAQNVCVKCHGGLAMPHPGDWDGAHPKAAKGNPSSCTICHKPDDCMKCHSGMPPADHQDAWKMGGHNKDGKASLDICRTCHAAADCEKCHGKGEVMK